MVRTGVVFVAMATSTAPVCAQSSAPTGAPARAAVGQRALQRAREAWDAGDFDLAPGLYLDALNAGGLHREEVVDALVHMGSALAVAGKKTPALTALRQAALLDPDFVIPPEAGKKAVALGDRARREQQRAGRLTVTAQAPEQVRAGAPFTVDVSVTPVDGSTVHSIVVVVRDSLAGRTYQQNAPPDARVTFDVALRMTLPGASLVVHVQAIDAHDNELASAERRVRVIGAAEHPAPAPVAARRATAGGFWTTAWPYIIGGATVAAGGAAIYFAARSTEDVNIGAPRVELVH
jgi:hypothetical protein